MPASDRAAWRLHHFSDEYADALEAWLDTAARSRKARTLVLQGPSSTGKTSLACAVAHAWWDDGRRVVIFATADTSDLLRPDAPAVGPLGPDTLVVLDDFGPLAIHWPSFRSLVNRLDAASCRIVTTTNLLPSEWRNAAIVDAAVRERLNPEGCLVVPLTEHLEGAPPEVPGGGPCPFHCELPGVFALGALGECDWPEVAALAVECVEAELQHAGPRPYYGLHRPDPEDYADVPPAEAAGYLAAAQQRWADAFDWHCTNTAHWCPHCRPEHCRPDGWLERRLAELGHSLGA
jgi:hypothetical protein